ncbi:tetratricopeptide repeat protein, partial [Algoriphagus sp.]
MRPVLVGILLFLTISFVKAQSFSIIDNKAIKMYQEGEELTLSRNYDGAIAKYKDAISREGSFLEAYVKLAQLQITQGRLEEAESTAIVGRSKLAGKNTTNKHRADIGWVFTNLYLKQGKFKEAFQEFQAADPLFDSSFKQSHYYVEMKEQMDFLATQLGTFREIEKERLPEPL